MRNLATLIALLAVGCTTRSDTLNPISPADAKSAVVTFVRDNPSEFIGNPDPAMLDAITLTDMRNGSWGFGAFTVDPDARSYSATVDVGVGESYLYEGDLITYDGTVIATPPLVTRYHAAITDPEY